MASINQTAIAQSVASFNAYETEQITFNEKRAAMGRTMCAILPLEISFEDYTATAKAWKVTYDGKTDNANDQAWNRAVGFMNGYLTSIQSELFVVPKSETKEAQAKAAKRAEHVAKVEAAAKQAKPADLQKRAVAGDKVAVEALAFIGKAAREAQDAKYAAMHKAVRAELKNATVQQWQDIAKVLGIKC